MFVIASMLVGDFGFIGVFRFYWGIPVLLGYSGILIDTFSASIPQNAYCTDSAYFKS